MTSHFHRPKITQRAFASFVLLLLAFPVSLQVAQAQVVSLDPDYTVSLLASGLELPDGGVIYRPSSHDFLVNQEVLGQIAKFDAITGAVTLFAAAPAGTPSSRGGVTCSPNTGCSVLLDLAINSKGEVFAPAYATSGPVLRFDASGRFLGVPPGSQINPGHMGYYTSKIGIHDDLGYL